MLFIELGIYSLTSLFAPLVDRSANKRTIFLACYPVMAGAAAVIGLALQGGFLTVPLLLGLLAVLSLLWDVVWAAYQVIPRLIVPPEDLFLANGLSGAIGGTNLIAGVAVGGIIVAFFAPADGAFLYAILLAVAFVLALPLSLPSPRSEQPLLESFRSGWRFFASPEGAALRQLAVVELTVGSVITGPLLLITLTANTGFGHPSTSYAALYVAYSVGGVLLGLVLGRVNPRSRIGTILVAALALLATSAFLGSAAPPNLALAAGLWFVAGASESTELAARTTWLQGRFPPDILARVISNQYVFRGTSNALGSFGLALLSTRVNAIQLAGVVGVVLALGAALALLLPGVRGMRF